MKKVKSNEAAERYTAQVMEALDKCFDPDPIHPTTYRELVRPHIERNLRKALAAEREAGRLAGIAESANAFAFNERESRRATVERIRTAFKDYDQPQGTSWAGWIDRILDEEAAR